MLLNMHCSIGKLRSNQVWLLILSFIVYGKACVALRRCEPPVPVISVLHGKTISGGVIIND
jgi:hypothetical protein